MRDREGKKWFEKENICYFTKKKGILDFAGKQIKQISLSLILVIELSEYWKSGSLHTKIQRSEGHVYIVTHQKLVSVAV